MKTLIDVARRIGRGIGGRLRTGAVETLEPRDGGSFRVRRATPADAAALLAMHHRLSPRTIHFRYLMAYRPPLDHFREICRPADGAGATLVAEPAGEPGWIAGMAYYRIGGAGRARTAEAAVLVEDAHQGKGLGRHLFRRLLRLAEAERIAVMETTVDPENEPMKRILRTSGYPAAERRDGGTIAIDLLVRPEHEADFVRDRCGDGRCGFQYGFRWA